MNINKRKSQKKISCLSFNKLDNYFRNPDLKIQNLHAISARKFTEDLDSMMEFSTKKLSLNGKIDKFSITMNSEAVENKEHRHLIRSGQKREKFRLHKILNKLFKYESHPIKKIKIKSWNFEDFEGVEKFQVGRFYAIKPVSLVYNSTQDDYKYNQRIISEFRIEEASGNTKKLIITDMIKNGKIRREKYIDEQKMNRQHYDFEIRSHRLSRSLMKTFLFQQIYKCKISECYLDESLLHNKIDSKFAAEKPADNAFIQTKETVSSTQKAIRRIPEEYVRIPLFKDASNSQDTCDKLFAADDHSKVQEIFEMGTDSIHTADDYCDLKRGKSLIFS